jgi:hypothetical protein
MLSKRVQQLLAVVVLAVFTFGSNPVRAQVGLWQFEEGAGALTADGSTAGNDAALVGGTAFADDAERGAVMSFDGTGYVETGAFVTEMGEADWTCAFWVKIAQGGGAIFSKQSDDADYVRIEKQLYVSAGPPGDNVLAPGAIVFTGNGAGNISSGGTSVADDAWHHIAIIYQRDRIGNAITEEPGIIYLDGEALGPYPQQNYAQKRRVDTPTDTFYIGRSPGGPTSNFIGLLDDVAIYDRVLDACEVRAVMGGDFSPNVPSEAPVITNAPAQDSVVNGFTYAKRLKITGCPPPDLTVTGGANIRPTGLVTFDTNLAGDADFAVTVTATNGAGSVDVSWDVTLVDPAVPAGLWQFEEEDGRVAADSSAAGNDGTLVGDVFFTNDPERGAVLDFDSGWVDTGAFVTEMGQASWTAAAWVKTSDTGGVIVSKQSDDGAFALAEKKLYLDVGGQASGAPAGAITVLGNGVAWVASTGPSVNDGEWHHVAMTVDTDLLGKNPGTVYVDGVASGGYSRQNWNGRADNSTDTLFIGRAPHIGAAGGLHAHRGRMDDVAMFSSALNACQIRAVMEGSFSLEVPPEVPVIVTPERESVVRGFTYATQLKISGCPVPTLEIFPEDAEITANGFVTFDTTLEPPGSDSFDLAVVAENEAGTTVIEWEVDLTVQAELAGLWRFEQLAGERTAVDCSIASNHGALVDGTSFVDDPERGSVMDFDGAGWVNTGAFVVEWGTADWTSAFWIKTETNGGVMLSKQSDDGAMVRSEKLLYVDVGGRDSGAPAGSITVLGNGVAWVASEGPAVSDGEWHHVAMTMDSAKIGLEPGVVYVDGQPAPAYTRQNWNGRADNPTDILFMGRTPQFRAEGTNQFVGRLDDVAIFNRVLSQDEVADVMEGGFDDFFGFVGATADDCLAPTFQRGDCNSDGVTDLSDGVALLNRAFLGADPHPCDDACDFNANGALDVSTAVYFFNALFQGGPAIPAPKDCGSANSPLLGCAASTCTI